MSKPPPVKTHAQKTADLEKRVARAAKKSETTPQFEARMVKSRKLQELSRKTLSHPSDFKLVSSAFNGEMDDRSTALLLGATVEMVLLQVIIVHLRLEDPLIIANFKKDVARDFCAIVSLARALSIIDAQTELHVNNIRVIRNLFAHYIPDITFNTPEIKDVCLNWIGPPNDPKKCFSDYCKNLTAAMTLRAIQNVGITFRGGDPLPYS